MLVIELGEFDESTARILETSDPEIDCHAVFLDRCLSLSELFVTASMQASLNHFRRARGELRIQAPDRGREDSTSSASRSGAFFVRPNGVGSFDPPSGD